MTFQRTTKLLGAVGIVSAMLAGSVSAQPLLCADRTALLKELNGKYHEQRTGLGIAAGNQGAMEFYVSEKGTWTILMTLTNGNTCIVAAGHSWQRVPVAALGPEA